MSARPTPRFELERDSFGRLVLTDAAGRRHEAVVPVRAFPLTAPCEALSILGGDGREIVWIDHLDDLPETVRRLIDDELASLHFVPEILRLESVSGFATPSVWRVETDRGATRLTLKSEEDIRRLADGRLLIASTEGLSYLVRDRAALDRHSRRLLERFL